MKKLFLVLMGIFCFSCQKHQLYVSYNVQNLFDDTIDGTEYREFAQNEKWTTNLYQQKLLNIAKVINLISAQHKGRLTLLALQEIENEQVLTHLLKHTKSLTGFYGVFAKGAGQSVGLALVSRYPITEVEVLDSSLFSTKSRPILVAKVAMPKGPLGVLVAHLPSHSSDPKGTLKQQAFTIMKNYITEQQGVYPFLLMGDLNGPTEGLSPVFVPLKAKEQGSYFFRGQWEQIDHMALSPHLVSRVINYSVFQHPLLFNAEEVPERWETKRAKGYSDHLPVVLLLE